ncbi:MAG: tRNA (N6-threonylcarbamoyladenosine(37)-N6)-methyltransferase TrmO [Methanotrichaceae archaeon]|nr:tRNA (N6-threonylcarbamoyladenosine(37)-N6)-methyltransferase TrmO [Methanotrichaceae archaeon]
MEELKIVYEPIGVIRNDFSKSEDPKEIRNSQSQLIISEKYLPALEGIEHCRYLIVVYHIDRSSGYRERVHPMGDLSIPERGVLATRSPCRPNPIGITVVEVVNIEGTTIKVTGLDALDGSPLLDIKPYEAHFDSPAGIQWEKDLSYKPNESAH